MLARLLSLTTLASMALLAQAPERPNEPQLYGNAVEVPTAVQASAKPFATLDVRLVDTQGNPLKDGFAAAYPASRHDLYTVGEPAGGQEPGTWVLRLALPRPGLYILRVGAPDHRRIEVPVVVDQTGPMTLPALRPTPKEPSERIPVCDDPRTLRWIAIYQGYVERKMKSSLSFAEAQGSKANHHLNEVRVLDADIYRNNWGSDLLGLSREMVHEKDAQTRALLAVCYLDLGFDGSPLNRRAVDLALRHLPEDSPFWSLSPQMPYFALRGGILGLVANWMWPYLSRMEQRNPDPEVRAFALLRRLLHHDAEGEAEDRRHLVQELVRTYPGTLAAGYLPSRFPHDFQ